MEGEAERRRTGGPRRQTDGVGTFSKLRGYSIAQVVYTEQVSSTPVVIYFAIREDG
jgi:hypothetical protein